MGHVTQSWIPVFRSDECASFFIHRRHHAEKLKRCGRTEAEKVCRRCPPTRAVGSDDFPRCRAENLAGHRWRCRATMVLMKIRTFFLTALTLAMFSTAACSRQTKGDSTTPEQRKETPVPTTAPNSRAEQAGGSANRPENFGDITNPKSPVKSPGAEKTMPAGGRPGTKDENPPR